MSIDYRATIISKEEKKVIGKIDCNFIKNCTSGWNIEGDEVYPSEEIQEIGKESSRYIHKRFMGRVNRKEFVKKFPYIEIHPSKNDTDSQCVYFKWAKAVTELEYIPVSAEEMERYSKLTKEEKIKENSEYLNVYLEHPVYRRGVFFDSSSFNRVIEDTKEQLKNIILKKREWEELQKTIDYLKLSEEEKENVASSYIYDVEDEDNYLEYRLESALKMKHLCETLEAYMFVYSDTAEYDLLPDYIKKIRS